MIHVHCSYTSHGQHHEATHRLPTRQQVMALIADRLAWEELTRMEIVPQGRKAGNGRQEHGLADHIRYVSAEGVDRRKVLGFDADRRTVVAIMRHNEDGSRFWFVSPLDANTGGGVMAPAFLTHFQELPEPPT